MIDRLFSLKRFSPFWLISFWALVLFVPFLPAIVPQPGLIIGYQWKSELFLAALLFLTLAFAFKFPKDKIKLKCFSGDEIYFIILPLALFVVWSGLSCFWAEDKRSAMHHTLLWACYVLFYILVRQIAARPKTLDVSLKVTILSFAVLSATCLIEYATSANELLVNFAYRYYKFAEIFAAMLPVFAVIALRSKRRGATLFGALLVTASWLVILVSLSRTTFIASVAGILIFYALAFSLGDWKPHVKKLSALLFLFAATFFLIQNSGSAEKESTTVARFNSSGKHAQESYNARYLFWGIGIEVFKTKPLVGVGADNYVTVYRAARENYSARDEENKLLEIDENVLPERAHNEFLQILVELGAVGAFLFAWFLAGILKAAVSMRGRPQSLLTVGALAGIAAFLTSSLASSYSFRVTANGMCFFFLLALVMSAASKAARQTDGSKAERFDFNRYALKTLFAAIGLIICATMIIFCAVRAASLTYLQTALSAENEQRAEADFQTAAALDERSPLIKYYSAVQLYNSEQPEAAIPQMRFAIDKGIATSVAYFYLAAAQIAAKRTDDAEQTFRESLRVYPRSIFLRTSYAGLLQENGRSEQAEAEFEKALKINSGQAVSWRTVETQGTVKLSRMRKVDETKYLEVMTLEPSDAIYAVLDFQRQNNPNLLTR